MEARKPTGLPELLRNASSISRLYAGSTMAIELPPDFEEFLRLLHVHGVEYLLIGGHAVGGSQMR